MQAIGGNISETRMLCAQQDREFEESLRIDQAKEAEVKRKLNQEEVNNRHISRLNHCYFFNRKSKLLKPPLD